MKMIKIVFTGIALIIIWYAALTGLSYYLLRNTENCYYITWDQEGDYLLWNSEPEFRDGLWMPTEDGFNCTFISEEALSVIADFKEVDQILKSGECVKIKKYIP